MLAVAAGLTTGMACQSRPAFLPAVGTLAIGGWFFPPVPMSPTRRTSQVAAFLLATAVAIAPITIRNYQIHHRFILISTNGPSTFLIGHVTHDMNLHASPDTNDAEMAERHLDLSLRYLQRNWGTYLSEIPECFQIIWTGDDFWPSTSTSWSRTRDPAMVRVGILHPLPGEPTIRARDLLPGPDPVRRSTRLVSDRTADGPTFGLLPAPPASPMGSSLSRAGAVGPDPLRSLCDATLPNAGDPPGVCARWPVPGRLLGASAFKGNGR